MMMSLKLLSYVACLKVYDEPLAEARSQHEESLREISWLEARLAGPRPNFRKEWEWWYQKYEIEPYWRERKELLEKDPDVICFEHMLNVINYY